jgi:hypothetical protein
VGLEHQVSCGHVDSLLKKQKLKVLEQKQDIGYLELFPPKDNTMVGGWVGGCWPNIWSLGSLPYYPTPLHAQTPCFLYVNTSIKHSSLSYTNVKGLSFRGHIVPT